MLNRFFFLQIVYIIILTFFQVFIFNRFNIFNQYNPFIYLIWLLFFPNTKSFYLYIILGFILGISIDLLMGTGGINAFACVFLASIRTILLKLTMGGQKDLKMFRWNEINFFQLIFYIFLGTFIHQLFIFYLEKFNIDYTFFNTLYTIFISSLITTIFIYIFFNIFKSKIVK